MKYIEINIEIFFFFKLNNDDILQYDGCQVNSKHGPCNLLLVPDFYEKSSNTVLLLAPSLEEYKPILQNHVKIIHCFLFHDFNDYSTLEKDINSISFLTLIEVYWYVRDSRYQRTYVNGTCTVFF